MSQKPEPGGEAAVDPALLPVQEQPGLPRVLLVGDSISIGYTLPVRTLLAGRANVLRPLFNCGPSSRGVEKHAEIAGAGGWDVIHFNFGLHDLRLIDGVHQVPLDTYAANLRTLGRLYLAAARKVIWCSTTPVPEGNLSPPRRPTDVPAYNRAALEIMAELKIPTHDLHAFATARLNNIQRPQNVHFTDAGSAKLAQSVAAAITEALH